MSRVAGIVVTALALSLSLVLTGCETFDPTSIFDSDIFSTKKKLPGERQAVFPEGTPGVSKGVPAEMVKGYQPPPEPEPAQTAAESKAKPKPKPKPKVVANPKEETKPTAVTVGPSSRSPSQSQWPDPPPR
jgi:cell division septation protein DedD